MRKNESIRTALKECGMYQWQLAKRLGISEPTFTRMMREELPEEEQKKIVSIIRGEEEHENE